MRKLSLAKLACIAFVFCAAAVAAFAQTLTTLHSFTGPDGSEPASRLLQATDGNFYGTTDAGGANDNCVPDGTCGTVFKVTPSGSVTTLYSFCSQSGCVDGSLPAAGLVQSTDGNFYGTTLDGGGGSRHDCGSQGCGTVFKITPGGSLTTLYIFCTQPNCPDGSSPSAGLTQATNGNFYGATDDGGTFNNNCYGGGCGTLFQITPNGTLTTLHSFDGTDGSYPSAGLTQGTDGNFYGTTLYGGNLGCNIPYGCGTVFKITAGGTLTTLYSFGLNDGFFPVALVQASDGNFYGTTSYGGTYGEGTVFKITPTGTLTTLHSFDGTDGSHPSGDLIQATDGNLYGATVQGGGYNNCNGFGCGTLFKINLTGTLTSLYSFCAQSGCPDGQSPYGGLTQGTDEKFYGTTTFGGGTNCGGTGSCGTIFSLTAPSLTPTTTVLMTAPNPSQLGQSVTLTATVTAQNGSTPTGTVVFNSNGVQIGSAQLNNAGVAVLIYSELPLGTESLTAMYQGAGGFAGSTSNTIMQVVKMDSSTTSVTSAPNPSTLGQNVTITATVSPSGPPVPTGTVGFASNGMEISGCSAVTLSSSQTAVCMTSSLALGTDMIVATYSGDSNYAGSSGMLSQVVNAVPQALQFISVTPCRVVDTRNAKGTFGGPPISGNTSRSFPLAQDGNPCGVPSSAAAYSLNVTVVPMGTLGYLTIWPTGETQPVVSTLNSPDGRIKANAAIVPAGTPSGSVSVYVTNTTNVILDIDGYFTAPSSQTYEFYPLTPCRVVDTRSGSGFPPALGPPSLKAQQQRDLPILSSTCLKGITTPLAYSFNVTVVPSPAGQPLGYLTVWPSNQTQPVVSTLNNPTATVVANAAIVPADPDNGDIDVYAYNSTDLIIDINGYFAAPGQDGLSLYAVAPCRVLDTRQNNGLPFMDEKTVSVMNSPCAPPSSAQAYVFNATVVPPGSMPFLTLWPDGTPQPTVSTLNAYDGFITSNMAIVPTTNGSIDAYAAGLTHLILDISGYFAP